MVFGGRKEPTVNCRVSLTRSIRSTHSSLLRSTCSGWKLVINDGSAKRLYALIADDNPPISSKRSILVFSASLLIAHKLLWTD